MKKRFTAFTLAEVLITLAIIGVIASMTIPTLINNYQKSQYETELKKTYSTMTQFFKSIMAEDVCSDLMCTGLFDSTIDNAVWQNNMEAVAKKHFKVLKTCKNGDTSCSEKITYIKGTVTPNTIFTSTSNFIFVMVDGTLVQVENHGCTASTYADYSRLKNDCAGIVVDLNGTKPPNTYGRDVFKIGNAYQNGDIYPDCSIEWVKSGAGPSWESSTGYWKNNPGQCGEPDKKMNETTSSVNGQNCLARIIENGWKIDYY